MHKKSPKFSLTPVVKKLTPLFLYCIAAAVSVGCATKSPQIDRQKPTASTTAPAVNFEPPERFVENLRPANMKIQSWRDMAPTLRKSIDYVNTKPQENYAVRREGLAITWGQMSHTLRTLEASLPALDKDPDLFLRKFHWVAIDGGIKYSGYYEPYVKASKTKKPGYQYPVYSKPPELEQVVGKGKKFHDRREIDEKGRLNGRGLELAYAADPVDIFYLQIQGSGRLAFEDGECIIVNYDGQNGHKYKSSGKIMREKGLLSEGHIFEQRQWFKNNPQRVSEILCDNPSYVFFKEGTTGPTGSFGKVIDPWLSIATDRHFIPLGAIVAYGVNIPDQDQGKAPLRAIGFAQDVGGAIKENRIDIFCGSDFRGEYVASLLDAKGPAWVLVANDIPLADLVPRHNEAPVYRAVRETKPEAPTKRTIVVADKTAPKGGKAATLGKPGKTLSTDKAAVKGAAAPKTAVSTKGATAPKAAASGKQSVAKPVATGKDGKISKAAPVKATDKRPAAPDKGGKEKKNPKK